MHTLKTFALIPLIVLALSASSLSALGGDPVDNHDYFDQYNHDRKQSRSKIKTQNEQVLATLAGPYINEYPRAAPEISYEIAEQILSGVMNHPVASLQKLPEYDPQGGIGFCFGRAMTVHIEALYRRISKSAIRKIWALGDLRTGNTKWRYHVTSMIKGPGNQWFVIDPIWGSVMGAEDWYHAMKTFDHDDKMRIYVTPASKFAPGTGKYAKSHLMNDFYNQYFDDLLRYYRENGAVSGGPVK